MNFKKISFAIFLATAAPNAAFADVFRPWMDRDVRGAWSVGYKGQGANVFVVDFFNGPYDVSAIIRGRRESFRHGEAMAEIVKSVAPRATVVQFQNDMSRTLRPWGNGFNIINFSMSMETRNLSWNVPVQNLPDLPKSVMQAALQGTALVIKGAGNDGLPIGRITARGGVDVAFDYLKNSKSTIFVGALQDHGQDTWLWTTPHAYSNYPGADPNYQNKFLFVGVSDKDFAYRVDGRPESGGTSAAAAIVSGYAAIIASKFPNASPEHVANRLLQTARKDKIFYGWNPSIYGRGEASLGRALTANNIK